MKYFQKSTDRRTFMKQTAATALLANGMISCAGEKGTEDKTGNVSSPFKYRNIELWSGPDGGTSFSKGGSVLKTKEMIEMNPDSTLGKFVEQCKEWGFNHMTIRGNPEHKTEAWHNFARYLKTNGIGMIVRRSWSDLDPVPLLHGGDTLSRVSKKFCPYSEETKAYWEKRIKKDFDMMPDLAGYRMNGTEFYINNGAPWMCDCDECKKQTSREKTIKAITLIADILSSYNAVLFLGNMAG